MTDTMAAPELGSPQFWDELEANPQRLAALVCAIRLDRLEQALQTQASVRAWINAVFERVKIEESEAEWEVTKARARALIAARSEKEDGKPPIAEIIKARAEIDPDVVAATKVWFDAQKKRGALKGLVTGLEDRVQMLQQLSANNRAEWRDSNRPT
jgi:hypothetical protein